MALNNGVAFQQLTTIMTDIDVDPTHSMPTKLQFFELKSISDDELDQELAEQLGSTSSPETVLAKIASQLPDKLEFKPGILEEGPTDSSLLPLIAEATATKNFRKLRRLDMSCWSHNNFGEAKFSYRVIAEKGLAICRNWRGRHSRAKARDRQP
jgi:hypothetical protein